MRTRSGEATFRDKKELPERAFASKAALHKWLAANHAKAAGLWILFAKKGSGHRSVTYDEAIDEALRFGWIDGLKKTSEREGYYKLRFGPRAPRSLWSRINRDKALALLERGEMEPAGMAAVEAAKADGRWERAYESSRTATVPDDLAAALAAKPKAAAFFERLDRANRYAVIWRVQTAKPALRDRRITELVAMLAKGERIHG